MSSRIKSAFDSVKEKKTVRPDKEIELEKGDFRALCSAAYSVFGPVVLAMAVFFAAVIALFLFLWT